MNSEIKILSAVTELCVALLYSSKMSAEDCYELGVQAFLDQNFKYSTQWFKESLNRLTDDDDSRWLRFDILGYLSLSYYKEGMHMKRQQGSFCWQIFFVTLPNFLVVLRLVVIG